MFKQSLWALLARNKKVYSYNATKSGKSLWSTFTTITHTEVSAVSTVAWQEKYAQDTAASRTAKHTENDKMLQRVLQHPSKLKDLPKPCPRTVSWKTPHTHHTVIIQLQFNHNTVVFFPCRFNWTPLALAIQSEAVRNHTKARDAHTTPTFFLTKKEKQS